LPHFIVNFRNIESLKINLGYPCIPHKIKNYGVGYAIAPYTPHEINKSFWQCLIVFPTVNVRPHPIVVNVGSQASGIRLMVVKPDSRLTW
jgi:hypothetical protein